MTARHYRRTRGFGQLLPTDLASMAIQGGAGVAASQATANLPSSTPMANSIVGYSMTKDQSGNVINCNSWWNFFNSACYGVLTGTGTPLKTDASGNPILNAQGQPVADCSQVENYLNGTCSLGDFLTGNPTGVAIAAIAVFALLIAIKI